VDARTHATDALTAVRDQPGAYDLVITDYMMPTLTGIALAERIHAIRRDLPVILTTGYSATLTSESVAAMGIERLLIKPLAVDVLGAAVFDVLNPHA
jgi:two-component system, cell cycle sensor histidine kinase and response regulator CckA